MDINCDTIFLVIKMNKKKITIIIVVAALVVCAVAGVIIAKQHNAKSEIETTVTTSVDAKDNTQPTHTTVSVVNEPDVKVETTKAEQTKSQMEFLTKNKWWYYFDVEKRECYAFSFKQSGDMDVAYFSNENIDVGDAKYFTGTSTFTLNGDKVSIKYLPDALPIKNFELTIKDNKLFNKDDKLAPHDDLSLDYPVGYFMVLDQMQ